MTLMFCGNHVVKFWYFQLNAYEIKITQMNLTKLKNIELANNAVLGLGDIGE